MARMDMEATNHCDSELFLFLSRYRRNILTLFYPDQCHEYYIMMTVILQNFFVNENKFDEVW